MNESTEMAPIMGSKKIKMTQAKQKRIQFDNLSSWPSWILIGTGIVSFIFGAVVYGFESNLFSVLGYFCIALFAGRSLLYKRYVGWNKKGMQLKFGWLDMKSIRFDKIQEALLDDNIFSIKQLDGKVHEYDIFDIASEDIERLRLLVVEHSRLSKSQLAA